MLRDLRSLIALTLFAGATACTEPLAPPTGPDGVPVQASADIVRGTGVFTFDGLAWFECAGETVRSVVYAPYTYQLVQMPTGEYVYTERWDTDNVTGTLYGQESGHVWTRQHNISPYIERSTGGGMAHFTFTALFVSETAPTIQVQQIFHVSRSATGDITAQKVELRCVRRSAGRN